MRGINIPQQEFVLKMPGGGGAYALFDLPFCWSTYASHLTKQCQSPRRYLHHLSPYSYQNASASRPWLFSKRTATPFHGFGKRQPARTMQYPPSCMKYLNALI